MNEEEQTEMLIRIDSNLNTLCKQFEEAKSEEGFPRCAKRGAQIKGLETSVGWLRKLTLGWCGFLVTTVIGGIIFSIMRAA